MTSAASRCIVGVTWLRFDGSTAAPVCDANTRAGERRGRATQTTSHLRRATLSVHRCHARLSTGVVPSLPRIERQRLPHAKRERARTETLGSGHPGPGVAAHSFPSSVMPAAMPVGADRCASASRTWPIYDVNAGRCRSAHGPAWFRKPLVGSSSLPVGSEFRRNSRFANGVLSGTEEESRLRGPTGHPRGVEPRRAPLPRVQARCFRCRRPEVRSNSGPGRVVACDAQLPALSHDDQHPFYRSRLIPLRPF